MVRVTIVQLEVSDKPEKSMEHAINNIIKACTAESEIICLPEQWYPSEILNIEEELSAIIDISSDQGICIIPGAFIERVNDERYISTPVIDNGKIIGKQYKIHPFATEKDKVKAGNKLHIFNYKGIKFGIAICHDIVFPEISRALTLKGSDIIFYPSKIHNEGIEPWHIYAQARALENRVVTIAPNVCNDIYGGRSIIVDIMYDKFVDIAKPDLVQASAYEQILVSDIDTEKIREIREIRLRELRDDYSSL
ncbi:MAG: carbon-nitrogen hydrolase family protein [Candidatus Nitrosothermus koennekii]|nr:MAG: carbon-nitrogen hydrolase family protein [Candidatus Nitrosothermus koennekii]